MQKARAKIAPLFLTALLGLSAATSSKENVAPSKCRDKPSTVCRSGHLFDLSLKPRAGPCKSPMGGTGCETTCALFADQHGNKACSHEFAFEHQDTPRGPSCWHWAYPYCAGSRQSPINIATRHAYRHRDRYPLTIKSGRNFHNPIITIAKYENNGHTIKATLTDTSSRLTNVYEGPLPRRNRYQIAQFHFHFNSAGGGSEHTIDGKAYDCELHIVTFNKKYGCFKAAMKHCDGLAVIAVMISSTDFKTMRNARGLMSSNMPNYFFGQAPRFFKNCGNNAKGPYHIPLKAWLPWKFQRRYYTYQGSLTTPPCSESVIWIVTKDGLNVDASIFDQMSRITVGDSHHPGRSMNGNRRPTQPLSGRRVYSSS